MTLRQAFILEGEQRGLQIGEQRGIQIGEQRGILATKRDIISKLKSKGLKKEDIIRLTGIDPGDFENL